MQTSVDEGKETYSNLLLFISFVFSESESCFRTQEHQARCKFLKTFETSNNKLHMKYFRYTQLGSFASWQSQHLLSSLQ